MKARETADERKNRKRWRRRLFLFFLAASCFLGGGPASKAQSERDTTINARYVLRAVSAEPGRLDGTAEHEFTITLKSSGITQQHQFGGLSGPSSRAREVSLGKDTQSNVQYRVANANTIMRVFGNESFTSTLTIKVSGNTCRLSYRAMKNPGHEYIVAAPYRGGAPARFRSFTMLGQHCEIT